MDIVQIYNNLMSSLPLGFSIVDREGRILEFNQEAEKITGYSREEVAGKSHLELLHGSHDSNACPLIRQTVRRRRKEVMKETHVKRKGGDYITIAITSFPISDPQGRCIGGAELFIDIAEAKRKERERSYFLSTIVHDMKSPLISSRGFLRRIFAGKDGPFSEKLRKRLNMINDNLEVLDALVGDFLDYARFDSKGFKPKFVQFDIIEALLKNIELLNVEFEKKKIQIRLDVPHRSALIAADDLLMNRVIANLLSNAVKYTNDGGSVTVRCKESDHNVAVTVINSGSRIPEDQMPYIFDAFYRAQRDAKGSGLGLSIAKKIIDLHKGDIWAYNTQQQETVLTFTLKK